MPETTDATAASAHGATVVDAMRMDASAMAVDSADDDDDDDEEYEEHEPVDSPKSITADPPTFGSRMDFMRARFNELSAALRAQERLLRHQQDIQEQAEALRSTAEALRAAHTSR